MAATVGRSSKGLSELVVSGGLLRTAESGLQAGQEVRIRVLGRDVAIALEKPGASSVLNVIKCEIATIDLDNSEALVHLIMRTEANPDAARLIARITRKSLEELGLEAGQTVYAMVKAVAINRGFLAS